MFIDDLRKKIFLDSQYCTYYNVNNNTVLAGIIRKIGYWYAVKLPDVKIKEINLVYRKFMTTMNTIVSIELLLYLYLIVFPYYTKIMTLPFFVAILLVSFVPLGVVYLTSLLLNFLYEKYLMKHIGTYKKIVFAPKLKYIDEKEYNTYRHTKRGSAYVLFLLAILFFGYVLVPHIVENFNSNKQYKSAETLSNIYIKINPINPEVYVQRAYSEFCQKKFKKAVNDYKLANNYSLSDSFDEEILGTQMLFLPYKDMLLEFDKAIQNEKSENVKILYKEERGLYKLRNKDYESAYQDFNDVIVAYEQGDNINASPEDAYYARGLIKGIYGDNIGSRIDKNKAKIMCPECKFDMKSKFIHKP